MKTSYISKHRWPALAGLLATLAILAMIVNSAQAVHDLGLFELDRNTANGGGPGDDWANLPGSAADFSGIIADVNDPSPNCTNAANFGTQFQGGGSKDDLDISSWLWKEGEPLDKDDITNAYAAAYFATSDMGDTSEGDLIIYFGLDRFDTNGSAQVGFWFLQSEVALSSTSSGGGCQFSGLHTNNDVLVQSNFTNGGVISNLSVFRWLNGALVPVITAADCATVAANDAACATVNQTDLAGEPPWEYLDKDGNDSFQTSAFFEGGINISRLIPAADCFTTFVAETRSSTPFDARLKDFALGDLDTCRSDIAVTKEPDDGDAGSSIEAGDTATFTIHVVNNGPDEAPDVTLEDELPNSGLDWSISSQPAGDPCSITGAVGSQVLTCSFGDMANGATRDITITSPTGSDDCGEKPNEVTIETTGNDPDITNNSDTGEITIACPNVSVVKTPDGDDIDVGTNAVFTILVTNNGPGQSDDVTLSDQLPTANGLDWSIVDQGPPPGFTGGTACSLSAGDLLTCDFNTMEEGASYRVRVSSATTVANCGAINNTVTIDADGDITASDDTDTGSIDVLCAAIRILKNSTKGTAVTAAGATFDADGPDSSDFTVVDNGVGDEDSDIGEICVSGLTVGSYTITETAAPDGYAIGTPPADVIADAVAGTHCGTDAAASDHNVGADGTVTFENPPLFDIQVRFRDGGSGEVVLDGAIVCTNVSTGTSSTTDTDEWDDTLTVTGIEMPAGGTVTVECTLVVDP
jgi:uncharacterized repeat protein (TIGR01451 family)